MATFDPKKLTMLSPDAEDWNTLLERPWRNLENMIEGVLLYPRKGMSKERLDREIIDWAGEQHTFSTGSFDIVNISLRGEFWAVAYYISSWYNHFNLNETE